MTSLQSNGQSDDINEKAKVTYGKLAKSSFFSVLSTYSTFILSIISSFLIARLINDIHWSYFIVALSYIQIIILILRFFPPELSNTLYYYIPHYYALGKHRELKTLIYRALVIKLIFLIPIFIVSVLFFNFFSNIFLANWPSESVKCLIILSPLIIINDLNIVLNSISIGFNRFKLVLILSAIQYSVYIGFLSYYYIFYQTIDLISLSLSFLIATIIPFIINLVINGIKMHNVKVEGKSSFRFKHDFRKIIKYGGFVRAANFFSEIWGDIQVIAVNSFEQTSVMAIKISRDFISISKNTSNAIAYPLVVSFTSSIATKERDIIISVYNTILKYLIFFIQIITGVLFFCIRFLISLIYSESRLIYSNIVSLYIFTTIFMIITIPLDSLLLADNKTKTFFYLRFGGFCLRLPVFLLLLIFFGLYEAIIGMNLTNLVIGIIYLIITIKSNAIKIDIKRICLYYLVFFMAITFTIGLEFLFLNNLNNLLLSALNITVAKEFNIFSVLLFVLVYFFLIGVFKILTPNDIENVQLLLNKENRMHKITYKLLNMLKILLHKLSINDPDPPS
ncbi:MAG: hypothetical protein EU531_02160 [Promethearchaeota archaeon]|nr:MAG: hypothetical protein EU531_02160 [Candidatus Lokiarchaeota archaeon]